MTIDAKIKAAQNVRDWWSLDTWRLIELGKESKTNLIQLQKSSKPKIILQELELLTHRMIALNGLISDSMPQSSGWVMYNLGKKIERALSLCSLLRSFLSYSYEQQVDFANME